MLTMQALMSPAVKTEFLQKELDALSAHNSSASAACFTRGSDAATVPRLIVTCMDERNTLVEEWLSLNPGEATLYCSGGGRFDKAALETAFGDALLNTRSEPEIYLVVHQCFANAGAGCAAFSNDAIAQERYFAERAAWIAANYPHAVIHALAVDTSTGNLAVKSVDPRGAGRVQTLVENALARTVVHRDEGHAGYGIYIGDAYRAWVGKRNTYFSISSADPNIASDAAIALKVMAHHSAVDLDTTPIVVLVDHPVYADSERTRTARRRIEAGLAEIEKLPGVADLMKTGALVVVKTSTDMRTWKGTLL